MPRPGLTSVREDPATGTRKGLVSRPLETASALAIHVTGVSVQSRLISHPLHEVVAFHKGAMMSHVIFVATARGDRDQPREVVEFRAAHGFQVNVRNVPRGKPSPFDHPTL